MYLHTIAYRSKIESIHSKRKIVLILSSWQPENYHVSCKSKSSIIFAPYNIKNIIKIQQKTYFDVSIMTSWILKTTVHLANLSQVQYLHLFKLLMIKNRDNTQIERKMYGDGLASITHLAKSNKIHNILCLHSVAHFYIWWVSGTNHQSTNLRTVYMVCSSKRDARCLYIPVVLQLASCGDVAFLCLV